MGEEAWSGVMIPLLSHRQVRCLHLQVPKSSWVSFRQSLSSHHWLLITNTKALETQRKTGIGINQNLLQASLGQHHRPLQEALAWCCCL